MNKDLININLFNLNPIPSWIYDYRTLQILDVNRAAIAHYGYTREEFLKLKLKDLTPPEELPKLIRAHATIKNQKGNIHFGTFTHQKKDGTLIQMEVNGHKLDFNNFECVLVVCQDITKRLEQEEQILQSEQRFRALVQEGGDMISIIDSNGKYSYTSPTTTAILGISPEEFQNNTVFDFIHPDDVEKTYSYMQRIATEKKVIVAPFRFKDGKNEWRWIETVLTNMLDNPAVKGIVANSRDITKQKREEHQLKLLSSVITSTKDAVIITEVAPFDKSGPKIIYVNEAFTKMTGYTADEIIGKTPKILEGPNSDRAELSRLRKAIRNWESCEITIINYKKNGEEFWVNFNISAVADEGGHYTHWIAIERDVTEQKEKELEKELLGKISLNFFPEKDLLLSSELMCETICDYGRFDLVELWMPNIENTKLQLIAHKAASTNASVFYEFTRDVRTFKIDEGLLGAVWHEKRTLFWQDIHKKDDFVRREAAEKSAIKNASGIPLVFNNQIVGMLMVATQKELSDLHKHVKLFEQLERFIGSEINRKKLENDLGYLYNTIPDMLCLTDFQGRFLKINKAGCDLLGYAEEEILYQTFDTFVHPDDRDISKEELLSITDRQITLSFENRYITKSGKVIWLSWTSSSSVEEGLIYATAKNITEEKKLRELNRQTRELAKVGGWEYDLIESKLFWSNEVHRFHETDPNTFIPDVGKAIDFYKEEYKTFVADRITKSITEGVYLDYEAIIITKGNKERWIRVIGNPEYIEGKCVKFIGSFQDITDRKEAEDRLQVLSDNIPGVVFQYLINPDGTANFRYVSKGAEKIWGYSANEIVENIDLVWNQTKVSGDFEAVKQSIIDSITNKSNWSFRFRTVAPNGQKRILQGLGTPEFYTDGTVLFNSVVLDITQETKNEKLLAQVTKIAKIGSWELDKIENKMYWSDTVYELHETDPTTFEPNLFNGINFYREDFREMVTEKVAKCIETGISYDFEAVIITAKKKERWIRSIVNAEIVNGKCTRLYGSFQDIQEQKESEIRLKSISDDLPGVSFQYIMTPDGKNYMQGVSKAAMKVWNISASDCELNNNLVWDQIKQAGDFEAVQQSIQDAIVNNKQWNFQWRNIVPNGEVRRHEGYGTPNVLTDGTIIFNSLIFDITEKYKAIELYDEVSKMAKIGSWELNLMNQNSSDNMYWSPMLKEIVEADKDFKPCLATCLEFFVLGSKEKISTALERLMEAGESFDLELQIETTKQQTKWVRCIGKGEFLDGKCQRVFGSFQDIHEQKIVELQKNSLQETLENSLNEIFIFDSDTFQFIYVNKGGLNNIGYSIDELKSLTAIDITPDFTLSSFKELITPLVNYEKEKLLFFTNHKRKDKSLYPVEVHLQLVTENGKRRFLAIIVDLTDRKRTEEEIRDSEEKRRLIMSGALDAIVCIDVNETITFWNPQAEIIFGWKETEVLGQLLSERIIPESFRNYHKEGLKNYLKTGEGKALNVLLELSAIKRSGEEFPIELTVIPIKQGEEVFFCAFIRDITERKKSETNILLANERFEKVTEATNDAIWDFDLVNNTLFWGKGFYTLFGYNSEVTKPSFDLLVSLIHEEDRDRVTNKVEQYMQDPSLKNWYEEYRFIKADGSIAFVIDRATFLRNTHGKVVRVIGAMTDISEQKNHEAQLIALNESLQSYAKELERSNEELEQFAFITSHDLQEPLRMVTSFLEQLKRKYEEQLDDKAKKYIHYATDAAKRMKQIILDLLEYSRAGKTFEDIEEIDINDVLFDYKLLRKKVISEKTVVLNSNVLPKVLIYRAPLIQTLHCLLDNAIKYSKSEISPIIQINSFEMDIEWVISIQDNGIGIEKEYFEKIFIIFQRLHNRDEYEGTGIGLTLSKRHVESWGGRIWLESAINHGTTFYFTIPKSLNF